MNTINETTTKRVMPVREHSVIPRKAPGKDLRNDYRMTLQAGLLTSLLVITGLFHMSFDASGGLEIVTHEQEAVELEEIQQTRQQDMPPPPPRPPVPIEVPNEALLEEDFLTLDASLDLNEPITHIPAPPPPREQPREEAREPEIFVVVEEMPEMIGGTQRLMELVRYPELARQAGLEGLVVVQVIVEPDGTPSNPVIMRSAGELLDRAAIDAVIKTRFKPGRQRGQAVRVSYAVPVRFRLRDASR
jgi:periplasmic protein TonB